MKSWKGDFVVEQWHYIWRVVTMIWPWSLFQLKAKQQTVVEKLMCCCWKKDLFLGSATFSAFCSATDFQTLSMLLYGFHLNSFLPKFNQSKPNPLFFLMFFLLWFSNPYLRALSRNSHCYWLQGDFWRLVGLGRPAGRKKAKHRFYVACLEP